MTKHELIYRIKRGINDQREEKGKARASGVEFATAMELANVFGKTSAQAFKRNWLVGITKLPGDVYSIEEFAAAYIAGDVPAKQGRRGRALIEKYSKAL